VKEIVDGLGFQRQGPYQHCSLIRFETGVETMERKSQDLRI
jgi:hypothetical protein